MAPRRKKIVASEEVAVDNVASGESAGAKPADTAPSSVAAVIDGGRAMPLGDGKGSVATVGRDIGDGAEVR